MNTINLHIDSQIFRKQRYGGISQYFNELKTGLTAADSRVLLSTKKEANLVHATFYYGKPSRLQAGQKLVSTLYDMTPEKLPEQFRFFPIKSPHANKKNWIKASNLVISISQASVNDLQFYWPDCSFNYKVIHLSSDIMSIDSKLTSGIQATKYLLYIGKRDGYKNASILFHVLQILKKRKLLPILIFAGGGHQTKREKEMIANLGLQKQVRYIQVCRKEIKGLIENSLCTLVTSMSEGFSLPIIESLLCRCPVVASDIEVHREVGGMFVDYISPLNTMEWANKIEERIVNNNFNRPWQNLEYRDQYNEVVEYYQPSRMIKEHIEAYDKLINP